MTRSTAGTGRGRTRILEVIVPKVSDLPYRVHKVLDLLKEGKKKFGYKNFPNIFLLYNKRSSWRLML